MQVYDHGDERILDFRKEDVSLPVKFINLSQMNMMMACGDGMSSTGDITNIEYWSGRDINVFCCMYDYYVDTLDTNITYLKGRTDLNIVLCLFDINNTEHITKLETLFPNIIDNIGSDDYKIQLNSLTAYKLLKPTGIIHDINPNETYYNSYKDTDSNLIEFVSLNTYTCSKKFIRKDNPDYTENIASGSNIIYNHGDKRILDFRDINLTLPEFFKDIPTKNMMLTCGCGVVDTQSILAFNKHKISIDKFNKISSSNIVNYTDIEFYATIVTQKINIFCCSYKDCEELVMNVNYLKSQSDLQIILCLFDNKNLEETQKLCTLFPNSIDNIGVHNIDIPYEIIYQIMKPKGLIYGVMPLDDSDSNQFNKITVDQISYDISFGTILQKKPNTLIQEQDHPVSKRKYIKYKHKYILIKK